MHLERLERRWCIGLERLKVENLMINAGQYGKIYFWINSKRTMWKVQIPIPLQQHYLCYFHSQDVIYDLLTLTESLISGSAASNWYTDAEVGKFSGIESETPGEKKNLLSNLNIERRNSALLNVLPCSWSWSCLYSKRSNLSCWFSI